MRLVLRGLVPLSKPWQVTVIPSISLMLQKWHPRRWHDWVVRSALNSESKDCGRSMCCSHPPFGLRVVDSVSSSSEEMKTWGPDYFRCARACVKEHMVLESCIWPDELHLEFHRHWGHIWLSFRKANTFSVGRYSYSVIYTIRNANKHSFPTHHT